MTKEEFEKKDLELDEEMDQIWGKGANVDGIACFEEYQKASPKILWILKEPNGEGDWSYKDFLIDISKCGNSQVMQTYGRITEVSYGMLKGITEYDKEKLRSTGKGRIAGEYVIGNIAVINVKKTGGKSGTQPGTIKDEYVRNGVKDFLLKQIEFIAPDIIINCYGYCYGEAWQFFLDQAGVSGKYSGGTQYLIKNKRLYIWTSHPNRAKAVSYFNTLLKIFNEWTSSEKADKDISRCV
jgi:hypothetical protein